MTHPQKATDEQLVKAYEEMSSCRKVAKLFGMCPQAVHERLQKLGVAKPIRVFTKAEEARLRDVYEKGFLAGDGTLKRLSVELNRTVPFLSRQAKKLGLTNQHRKCSKSVCDEMSERAKRWYQENEHPRGFLGGRHTKEMKEIASKRSLLFWASMTGEEREAFVGKLQKGVIEARGSHVFNNRDKASWKAGWREIGGVRNYYRSRWEANYARYLEYLKQQSLVKEWIHEPKTFLFENVKRGKRSYLPDFLVVWFDGSIEYHEIKGWVDDRSKAAMALMDQQYPEIQMVYFFGKDYKIIEKRASRFVDGWE